jgi:GDP-L-fucose synthase
MSSYVDISDKVFIAGHRGLVGSAIYRKLQSAGFKNLIVKSRADLDLLDQPKVQKFFETEKPQAVIDAAAKVGGIVANRDNGADFLFQNLQIQNNLIYGAYQAKVKSFIFLGSSCIFPRECPQPIKEEYLLTGPLEETNRAYAIAKISGVELIDSLNKQYKSDYVSLMPCNMYGPNDNYDPVNSHVLPALIRKFFEAEKSNAKTVSVWGTGTPLREFMHSDDLAEGVLKICTSTRETIREHFVNAGCRSFLNIGAGSEVSIGELAKIMCKVFDFKGELVFDRSKPDGTMRKIMDSSRFRRIGWAPKISIEEGLARVVKELRANPQPLEKHASA